MPVGGRMDGIREVVARSGAERWSYVAGPGYGAGVTSPAVSAVS